MARDYFKRVSSKTPTAFWINNVTREEARLAIEAGAEGCTQNPTFISKVLKSETDGDYAREIFQKHIASGKSMNDVVAAVQLDLIGNICDIFLPMYEASRGKKGYVSIQADPYHEDVDTILKNAYLGHKRAPNMLIKIPATKEGLQAMSILVKERIPILATEVMSMDQVIRTQQMYDEAVKDVKDPAIFICAHINGIFDESLAQTVEKNKVDMDRDALWQASFLLGRKIVEYFNIHRSDIHYLAGGARGLHHFTDMVGVSGAVTINWKGTADKLIELDGPVCDRFSAKIPEHYLDELMAKSPDFKKSYIPGSLKDEEFETFVPVVHFRDQFEAGWAKAIKEGEAIAAG